MSEFPTWKERDSPLLFVRFVFYPDCRRALFLCMFDWIENVSNCDSCVWLDRSGFSIGVRKCVSTWKERDLLLRIEASDYGGWQDQ